MQAFDYQRDPSWRIFRIMAEFVQGFTFLSTLHKTATIFGSARFREGNKYYEMSRQLGKLLALQGFTVVTGGGPGIMEAGNRGAHETDAPSIGLNIELPFEQKTNPYVTQSVSFYHFFTRKVMLDFSAHAFIFFPGGFGTLDELFEVLTLIQTGKIESPPPVFLVGAEYWTPLLNWIKTTLLETNKTISPQDVDLLHVTDDLDYVVRHVRSHMAGCDGLTSRMEL